MTSHVVPHAAVVQEAEVDHESRQILSPMDELFSILTDGLVRDGVLLGETWESLCARKFKAPPTANKTILRTKELTEDERKLAATLYEEGTMERYMIEIFLFVRVCVWVYPLLSHDDNDDDSCTGFV
jgi:hypothetical protein